MALTKVTAKGQITIPHDIREKFDIYTGCLINIDEEKDKIVIKKMKPKKSFFGIWKNYDFNYDLIKGKWKEWNERKNMY